MIATEKQTNKQKLVTGAQKNLRKRWKYERTNQVRQLTAVTIHSLLQRYAARNMTAESGNALCAFLKQWQEFHTDKLQKHLRAPSCRRPERAGYPVKIWDHVTDFTGIFKI